MNGLVKISELFEVSAGTDLELNALTQTSAEDPDAIAFVSRSEKNNGVSAFVRAIDGISPHNAGTISVAAGGSVLASFVQPRPFYSSYHLYVLTPKQPMPDEALLFYCFCIKKNRFRYSFGRQANKTLSDLLIPSKTPHWVSPLPTTKALNAAPLSLSTPAIQLSGWKNFRYDSLFEIVRGRGPRKKELSLLGSTPFISSSDSNNGLSGYTIGPATHEGNVITVNRNGSVGEAYYQPIPFCSTEDVHVFRPKFDLNPLRALFLVTLIRKEKYRYNFGRKWGLARMKSSTLPLPVNKDGDPDWFFMETTIKSCAYSQSLA